MRWLFPVGRGDGGAGTATALTSMSSSKALELASHNSGSSSSHLFLNIFTKLRVCVLYKIWPYIYFVPAIR